MHATEQVDPDTCAEDDIDTGLDTAAGHNGDALRGADYAEQDVPLARILDKLSRQPDFPSLSEALTGVRRVVRSEKARLQSLAEVLLNDVGLTHRVLRLANAAHYRSAGAGQITTLSRAIAVMGFTEIGQVAVASRLVDRVRDPRHGKALREEFLRALLAGALAHELSARHDEEAHLVAVCQNLGRLVACLHLPEDAIRVRAQVGHVRWPRGGDEQRASRRCLGVGYARLGQAAAERWGWPELLRRAIRHDEPPLHTPAGRAERLRTLGLLSNELADLMIYVDAAQWDAGCDQLQRRLGPATAHDARSMRAAMARARERLDSLCDALELPLSQLPGWGGAIDPANALGDSAGPQPTDAAMVVSSGRLTTPCPPASRHDVLGDGVHDVVQALAEGLPPADVQTMVVETLLRGLGGHRAVLCLRTGRQGDLVGRIGLGCGAASAHQHFLVPPDDPHDLFSLLCAKGADTFIDDATDPAIAVRLPRWWRLHARSRSFLVLPLMQGRQPVGMLYCDAPPGPTGRLDDASLKLARTLRSQALIAWRQMR